MARAYAVLGLRPGAPIRAVRTRYLTLAKKWHPDRFVSDPQGQAEATIQMREITDAYHHLATRLAGAHPEVARAAKTTGPLSREQVDGVVSALGSNSPVDWFLDYVTHEFWVNPWRRSAGGIRYWAAVAVGYLAALCAWSRYDVLSLALALGAGAALGSYLVLKRVLPSDWK